MNNPEKKERKRRIKAQDAERKSEREVKPLTPEQMEAVRLMARGLFAMIMATLPQRDEFPSELDVN